MCWARCNSTPKTNLSVFHWGNPPTNITCAVSLGFPAPLKKTPMCGLGTGPRRLSVASRVRLRCSRGDPTPRSWWAKRRSLAAQTGDVVWRRGVVKPPGPFENPCCQHEWKTMLSFFSAEQCLTESSHRKPTVPFISLPVSFEAS